MMAMTVLAEGVEWEGRELTATCTRVAQGDTERAERLEEQVVGRFENLCEAAGILAYWNLAAGTVMGPVGQRTTAAQLCDLRRQAMVGVLGVQ